MTDDNTTAIEEDNTIMEGGENKWLVKVKRKKDVDNYWMVDY